MPFKPGQARPEGAGRKKGTLNRASMPILELMESRNFNALDELIKLLPDLEPNIQAKVLCEIMSFVYPKKKALDISGDINANIGPLVSITLPSNMREALPVANAPLIAIDAQASPSLVKPI